MMCYYLNIYFQGQRVNLDLPVFHLILDLARSELVSGLELVTLFQDGHLTESCEELGNRDTGGPVQWSMPPCAVQRAQSTSCLDLTAPTDLDKLR